MSDDIQNADQRWKVVLTNALEVESGGVLRTGGKAVYTQAAGSVKDKTSLRWIIRH